ncbi:MAG: RloB domain-containing protein [Gemmatimonadetes bacterium]|nr:RloB domain-containing protein [Gemmatimonadota bacterium]
MARRKPRRHGQLRRRGPKREPYDRVLIVCEGKKTEPLYFQALKDRCRLSTANVVITGNGSDPSSLVNKAKSLRDEEKRRGDQYDAVYCVFDRDQHAHFNTVSNEALSAKLKLARSWPCFEFWLLLHFVYRRGPYAPSGNRSAADNCVGDLQQHLTNYTKGNAGVFEALEDQMETAKSNAGRALLDVKATGRCNPSTEVHCLVAYLQALKS